MNKVQGFVLGLILMVTGAVEASVFSTSRTSNSLTKWEFLCAYHQVDCSDIPEPKIVRIPLTGLYGVYLPNYQPDVVFVNPTIDPTMQDVVTIHEMSHYLDYQRGLLVRYEDGYDVGELCRSEAKGFNVANAWVVYNDYDQSYAWYDWINSYPHCQ